MSRDTHITCVTCKEALWIGQSDIIYLGDDEVMQALQKFLIAHRTYAPRKYGEKDYHELLFMPEPYNGSFEDIDWKYWGED